MITEEKILRGKEIEKVILGILKSLEGKVFEVENTTTDIWKITFEEIEIIVDILQGKKILVTIKTFNFIVTSDMRYHYNNGEADFISSQLSAFFSQIQILFLNYKYVEIKNGTIIDSIKNYNEIPAWQMPA